MSLMGLIARGFNAKTVMDMFIRKYPQHKKKIQAATAAGFGYNTLARVIDGKKAGKPEEYLTDHEKTVKAHSDNRKRAAMGVVGAAGALGALAAGGYHYATRNRAIRPNQILPPQQDQQEIGSPGGGGRGPQGQTINVTPQQSGTRNVPALPNQQGMIPYNPQMPRGTPPSVMPSGPVIIPPYEHNPQQNVSLVKNIREDKRIMEALSSGLPMAAVTQLLRETLPKGKIHIMEKAPGGFEQVLEDFDGYRRTQTSENTRLNQIQKINERNQKPLDIRQQEAKAANEGRGIQALRQQEEQPIPQEMITDPQQMQEMQQMDQMQVQEPTQIQPQGFDTVEQPVMPPEIQQQMQQQQEIETGKEINKPLIEEIKNLKKEEKPLGGFDVKSALANMVITPKGVGEIKHKGKAGVIAKVDGKDSSFKHEDIEELPDDFEETVRTLVKAIPEKEKSTAIQSAVYVPISANKSVTLMKFYDGKIAWYLDVPYETYKDIALGTYSPKNKDETSIAKYTPGVFDSRGAGFHTEIKTNPKYNGDNKNITWGYAENEYDAMQRMQPILKKMSRERVDENGKIIEPKRKRKSS